MVRPLITSLQGTKELQETGRGHQDLCQRVQTLTCLAGCTPLNNLRHGLAGTMMPSQ